MKWINFKDFKKRKIMFSGTIGIDSRIVFVESPSWLSQFWRKYKEWDLSRHYKEMREQVEWENLK